MMCSASNLTVSPEPRPSYQAPPLTRAPPHHPKPSPAPPPQTEPTTRSLAFHPNTAHRHPKPRPTHRRPAHPKRRPAPRSLTLPKPCPLLQYRPSPLSRPFTDKPHPSIRRTCLPYDPPRHPSPAPPPKGPPQPRLSVSDGSACALAWGLHPAGSGTLSDWADQLLS
ncbi:hypothetical protein chiPu_0017609 [Chiloscyllium punctatum]|uniref:Uncharacterized protein n=1 Tax=Chiloscyllium punctatum TaxID=137246 RepID=A0A401RHE5_CHIPU|nr:hypothetical protein [Chiloscyllium punctatum]